MEMSPAMMRALVEPYRKTLEATLANCANAMTDVARLTEENEALKARIEELEKPK